MEPGPGGQVTELFQGRVGHRQEPGLAGNCLACSWMVRSHSQCCNKAPPPGWLTNNRNILLTMLKADIQDKPGSTPSDGSMLVGLVSLTQIWIVWEEGNLRKMTPWSVGKSVWYYLD